jgi:ribonucleoside-diphosphate reductase alpha chain
LQRQASPGYDNALSFVNAATDALLFTQTFCCLAEEEGLGICFLGTTIYQPQPIIEALELPELVFPIATLTVGWPAEKPRQTDRLPLQAIVHQETYNPFTPERIDACYKKRESLAVNKHFVELNEKETLAQVFTDIRYTRKDNEVMSENLLATLIRQKFLKADNLMDELPVVERRPDILECDVVRFQNKKEKWVAFVGMLDGVPYEIFTGLQDDEEGIAIPKSVNKGFIIKHYDREGQKRYDFQFVNKRGYKTTIEGLSERFNPKYWDYAKLISGVLRYRMPIDHVISLITSLQLENDTINSWTAGVARVLKKYLPDSSPMYDEEEQE